MTRKRKNSRQPELAPGGVLARDAPAGFGSGRGGDTWLFPEEAAFLVEKGELDVGRPAAAVRDFFSEHDARFRERFAVYRDLRKRGYVPKSGAKFGADFRVYEKGVKPGEGHAKYLVRVVRDRLDVRDLMAASRVAHTVKKRLLLAVVDRELEVTYLQNVRVRP